MNRRFFLHKGALAVAGTTAMPNFLVRSVLAQTAGDQCSERDSGWSSSSSAARPTD